MFFIVYYYSFAAAVIIAAMASSDGMTCDRNDELVRQSTENLLLKMWEDTSNATHEQHERLFIDTFAVPPYQRTTTWLEEASKTMDKLIWESFCTRILVKWSINLCFGVNCPYVLCKDAASTRTSGTLVLNAPLSTTQSCGFVISNPGKRISVSCQSIGTSSITYNGLSTAGYTQTGTIAANTAIVLPDGVRLVVNSANLAVPLSCSWTAFSPPTLDG